eukprot:8264239-Pyramimonas_sp.AAC.1
MAQTVLHWIWQRTRLHATVSRALTWARARLAKQIPQCLTSPCTTTVHGSGDSRQPKNLTRQEREASMSSTGV